MSVNIYDKENNKLIRTADMLVEGGGGEVIDNLTSTDIDKALSANQGRILNENKIDISLNNIDESGVEKVKEIVKDTGEIVLLANDITPSTPAPRDADTLGGISAGEYAKRMDPNLQGVVNNTSFSTENKQMMNGFGEYMWVGNPELNSVNIQTAKRTLNADDIQKALSVTNTPLDVTIPPRSSVNFSNIVTNNPGHFPLFTILTAAAYGDYVTINQSHYPENGKITTSGFVGNWSDNEVTVMLSQQTLWFLND